MREIALWLHNKLGGSDTWISGSIASQLNKDVLTQIKEIFPDLQPQVRLKLILSFFQIPRRHIDEWRTELEEILEAAAGDSELWVSMLAETMKTFPSTGSLNTDVSNYESSHRIFIDMVNELKKVVNKTNDLGMLPLECQYLNKTALTALVGLRPEPTKHFIVKRKPKSFFLRQELIQKSMDAQSSLKKISAPTVPLRSRGIPRKMTDTTPMKGIPSRVPTGGFRSPPTSQANNRPSVSRVPAGRKDGGIKLLEIEDQPLGYAAAKKRKRQQELEEQQKRALENQEKTATSENNANTANTTATSGNTPTTPSTPDYAAGLTATNVYSQPATPMPSSTITSETIQIPITTAATATTTTQIVTSQVATSVSTSVDANKTPAINHVVKKEVEISAKRIKVEHSVSQEDYGKIEIKTEAPTKIINNNSSNLVTAVPSIQQQQPPTITLIKTEPKTPSTPKITRTLPTLITTSVANSSGKSIVLTPTTTTIAGQSYVTIKAVSTPLTASTSGAATISNLSNLNIPSTTKIVRTVQYVSQAPQTKTNTTASVAKTPTIITGKPTLVTKTVNAGQQVSKPTILSNIILTPQQSNVSGNQTPGSYTVINTPNKIVQRVVASGQNINIPTLTSTMARQNQQTILQNQQTPTKIVQIQTTPAILNVAQNQNSMKNIPPLISTQQPTTALLNYQTGTRKVTITQQPAPSNQNNPNIQRITLSQAQQAVQQQQQQQLQHNQQTGTHVITSANPQKLTQLMVPSSQKGKTIILTNPNLITQKNSVILQSVGPSGNPVYQQIPLQNVSGLTGIRGATIVTSTPPGLIKTVGGDQSQKNNQQIPALVPTSNLTTQTMPGLTPVVIATSNHQQQQQLPTFVTKVSTQSQPNQVQIRPVLTTINQQPQLTLIQRPGQQPQLVQTISPQQQTIQRAVITTTQPQQTIQIQQQPTQIVQQQQTSQASSTQRRGLSLSSKHIMEAHDMFKKANRVTRLDKALILGFMAGYRDNPRPNPDNVLTIKLNESKELVKQPDESFALMLVDTLIRLDYNTGEWKTFRTCRKIDPASASQQQQQQQNESSVQTNTSSVVI